MKRLLSLLLVFTMFFSLAACGNSGGSKSGDSSVSASETETLSEECSEDARPELAERLENFDQYDTIFLGYPNWWYGVPMALLTFLESQDFSGKQVYLFCSHGTGGLAGSVEIITEAIPGAMISDNIFDCYEEEASSSQEEIQNWVSELDY